MSSACVQGDPSNGRNCHYVIGGLGGIIRHTFSLGIRNWKGVHCSDKGRFLSRPVDGRVRVWWHRNTAFQDGNVMGTTTFSGGGITVWGCFYYTPPRNEVVGGILISPCPSVCRQFLCRTITWIVLLIIF